LGVEFSVGQLCVDVQLKGTASYFDDIKYAINKVTDWEGKLQNKNGKTTIQSTQHTLCNSINTFYLSCISFPYKLIHVPEGPVGTDEYLRVSLGRLERNKFLHKQVELQIHKQWNFGNKPRSCAANLFKSGNTKVMVPDGHCNRIC
jgi:hypothetical protein